MQMIARIELGAQPVGMSRIAERFVKIDNFIEVPGRANPGVYLLAIGFGSSIRVVVIGAGIRRNRSAIDAEMMGMGSRDQLIVGVQNAANERGVLFRGDRAMAQSRTEIVDTFQNDDVPDAGLGQHIAIEARESVGTEPVVQKTIAANPCIEHPNVWKPASQNIRPAIVAIGGGAVPVGDGVA